MAAPPWLREEAFSFWTHAVGAVLALVGIVLLLDRATDARSQAALFVYGASMSIMFATSSLHHVAHREDGLFRRLDMTAIYLFIAGTYTPFCLLVVPLAWGLPMLALAWTLAAVGIALRWLRPVTPRWVTVGLYLGLGWMGLAGAPVLVAAAGWPAVLLLAGGGAVYSVGAVVYARRWPDPWPRYVGHHGLWHVFVMGGAALHFLLVWRLTA